jgi:hypothetical protein
MVLTYNTVRDFLGMLGFRQIFNDFFMIAFHVDDEIVLPITYFQVGNQLYGPMVWYWTVRKQIGG